MRDTRKFSFNGLKESINFIFSRQNFMVTQWEINKSNKVRTLDAFSCVLVLQLVLVIFYTHCFVLLLLKCSLDCLTFTFHTLTYLYFSQNRHFFMISTRLWLTDRRTVVQNSQDSGRKYWVICSSARTAHSFACSALLASLARFVALTRSRAHGKEVFRC